MLINSLYLSDSSGILKFLSRHLLDCHDDAIGASYCDCGTAAIHSFECVLHLEKLTVGGEDCVGLIVCGHVDSLVSFYL